MSQNIFSNINPSATSGNDLATLLNDFKDAVASGFSGTARPANLQAGGYWIDTAQAASPDFLWKYKVWTGTVDILVFTLNINTNTILISGTTGTYTVSQTSADAVGPILALLKKRIATNGQTLVGDVLGEVQFKSTDDLGAAVISARIKAVSNNSTTSSQAGAYLVFEEINTNSGAISEKMRLFDGKLGVGNTAPTTAIHITSLTGFTNERIDDSATGPVSHMKKSRIAGSGQVLSGDSLGKYNFKSTDETGAEIDGAVVIESFATQNHSSTAQGSKVTIGVKNTGATTVTEKMSIGDVVSFPEGDQTKTQVIGSSGTAATNVKLNRSGTGKMQVVLGNDATAEGSSATVLAEVGNRPESFTNSGRPAAGNVGRTIWISDLLKLQYDNGTTWVDVRPTNVPTVQKFTSGSGTYTTPAGALYLRVRMVAGGGGGGGSGVVATVPLAGSGGNTTFGTSLLTCTGGTGGTGGGTHSGGFYGAGTISLPAYGTRYVGTFGGAITSATPIGGRGGQAAGYGGVANQVAVGTPFNAVANTGAGGSGAGQTGGGGGSGGGSGGSIDAIIPSPLSATYAYTVGDGGVGGAAGTSGAAGSNGGSGYIEVTEYYQ